MKVSVKNFQSAEDVDLEIQGLTVLVGKSNIGKSSIRRAIQGAFINRPGETFVTEGKTTTDVHIQCPEIDLRWRKGGPCNDYVVNGEELTSVSRGAPPQIAEAGFRDLEVSGGSVAVQVADQFSPLFLLSETGSVAAEAISDVGRLGDIQKALKACEKDRRALSSRRKVREEDLADAITSLDLYEDLESDLNSVDDVEAFVSSIEELEDEIESLKKIEARRQALRDRLDALHGVEDISIPSVDVDDVLRDVQMASGFFQRFQRSFPTLEKYADVVEIEIPEVTLPTVPDVSMLEDLDRRRRKSEGVASKWKGIEEVSIPPLDFDDAVAHVSDLLVMKNALDSAAIVIPRLKEEVFGIKKEIELCDQDFHDALHEAGQCPTCEREVS